MQTVNDPQDKTYGEKPTPARNFQAVGAVAGFFLKILEMPLRFIFGRDIFFSYSRRDSREYAPNLAQVVQKRFKDQQKRKVSIYLDRWIAPGTAYLPLSLRLQLRWCNILVVVCGPNAAQSTFVKDEVTLFGKLRRKVLIVDVDGAFEAVRANEPWVNVAGADPESETPKALERGKPSEHVIERLLKMHEFTTQDRRLRRLMWATLTFVLLSVGGTVAYSFFTVKSANARQAIAEAKANNAEARADTANGKADQAERRAIEAETRAVNADAAAKIAKQQKLTAESERNGAIRDKKSAEAQTKVALTAKTNAETAAAKANTDRDKAQRDAETQTRVAKEQRDLADEAKRQRQEALRDSLEGSASRVDDSLGELNHLQNAVLDIFERYLKHTPDETIVPDSLHLALTDAAVRAKELGVGMGELGFPDFKDFDIAPNGNLLITVGFHTQAREDANQTTAALWDVRTRQPLWETGNLTKINACAISPDSKLVVLGTSNGQLLFFNVAGANTKFIYSLPLASSVDRIRFTENGQHVLVWANGNWDGTNLYLTHVFTGNSKVLNFAPLPKSFLFGNSYWYNGDEQEYVFNQLPYAPNHIGVLGDDLHLKIANTETGISQEFDLTQKRITRYTGNLDSLQASLLSADGRWFVGVPQNQGLETTPFAIDLKCVSGKGACDPVYLFDPIHYQKKPQVAFDPSNKLLLITESERILRIYKTENLTRHTHVEPKTLELPWTFTIKGFTTDNKQVIILANNTKEGAAGELRFYELERGRLTRSHPLEADPLWDRLNLRQALGSTFQVGLTSTSLRIWEHNASPGLEFVYDKKIVGVDIGRAIDASQSPDGGLLATAHPDGYVALWRISDRQLLGIIRGFQGGNVFIEWRATTEGPVLYMASRAGQLFKWIPDKSWKLNGSLQSLTPPASAEIMQFQVSKDGQTIAFRDAAGIARILAHDHWTVVDIGQHPFALSDDGSHLAVASNNGGATVVDIASKQVTNLNPSEFIPCSADKIHFAVSDTLVVTESCRGVLVWNATGGGAPLTEPDVRAKSGIVTAPTDELWARYDDGYVKITNLRTGKLIAQVPGRVTLFEAGTETRLGGKPTVFSFAQSTKLAAAGHTSNSNTSIVQVWRLDSGEMISYMPYAAESKRVEFMPGGDALLLVGGNGVPVIVPFETREQFKTLCPLISKAFEQRPSLKDFRKEVYESCTNEQNAGIVQSPVWVVDATNNR